MTLYILWDVLSIEQEMGLDMDIRQLKMGL